jgi:hypothetical protein
VTNDGRSRRSETVTAAAWATTGGAGAAAAAIGVHLVDERDDLCFLFRGIPAAFGRIDFGVAHDSRHLWSVTEMSKAKLVWSFPLSRGAWNYEMAWQTVSRMLFVRRL